MRPGEARDWEGIEIETEVEIATDMTRAAAVPPDFLAGGGEVGARMRALDWSATPLGAPEGWPQSLKTIVRVMLDSRYAMWMLWGPELTFFCNDAYLPTVGIKRDWVLGARSDKVWEEIWPDIGPRIARVLEQARRLGTRACCYSSSAAVFSEETYHTFSYSPVYDDESRIAGMLCVVTEVTERVISERRLRALSDLAGRAQGINGAVETCSRACEVLATYPLDVPYAALYLVDEAGERRAARVVASTRDAGQTALPRVLELTEPPRWLAKLLDTERLVELDDLGPRGLGINAEPWPDLVRKAFAVPLKGARQHGLAGFLVAGLSPRRPPGEATNRSWIWSPSRSTARSARRRPTRPSAGAPRRWPSSTARRPPSSRNVSHEFRTPLTLMLGPLEDALAATDDAAARGSDALELAHRNALRLLKLVNSLLDFSRIEAGRVQALLTSRPTSPRSPATSRAPSAPRSSARASSSRWTAQPLAEPRLRRSRDVGEDRPQPALERAQVHVRGQRSRVRLRATATARVLRVADTGTGIPAAGAAAPVRALPPRRRRARPHARGHGHRARARPGARALHGGTVDVDSELGRGTAFHVPIPLGSAHLPADRVAASAGRGASGGAAQAFVEEALRWLPDDDAAPGRARDAGRARRSLARTVGARILLADDNADMRDYVRRLLAPHYAVEAVADGEAALAAARARTAGPRAHAT